MDWEIIEVTDQEYPVTYLIKIDKKHNWIKKHPLHITRNKNTHRPIGLKVIINGRYLTVHQRIRKCKLQGHNIHHKNMNHLDCRSKNLQVIPKQYHEEIHKVIKPDENILFANAINSKKFE